MSVGQALSLLWQAARPSPHLREAVELVEAEMERLKRLVDQYEGRAAQFDGSREGGS